MPITLQPGVSYQLNVSLIPLPAELYGKVTDFTSGNPIVGANISVVGHGNPNSYQDITDENGDYDIQGIVPGEYDVTVTATGYNPGYV